MAAVAALERCEFFSALGQLAILHKICLVTGYAFAIFPGPGDVHFVVGDRACFLHNSEAGAVEIVGASVPWKMVGKWEANPRGGSAGATFRTARERPPFLPQELRLVVSPTLIVSTFLHGSEYRPVAEARVIVP